MNALFGTEFSLPMKFFVAFAIVLLLIGAVTYLVRRFGAGGLTVTVQRNRQPRLAVVDSTPIDNRRKLVIVRRDNTEHLLLIGGPTDVLVEPNIVRAAPAQTARETPALRSTAAAEPAGPAPITALDASGWPLAPSAEPVPRAEPITRIEPARPEPIAKPEPITRAEPILKPAAPAAPVIPTITPVPPPPPAPTIAPAAAAAIEAPVLAAKAPDPVQESHLADLAATLQASEPVATKAPPAAPPLAPPVTATADEAVVPLHPQQPTATPEEQNLAEMAQRLEAALRRPTQGRPAPATAPAAPTAAARPRPATAVPPPPAAAPPRPPATSYESLQREMANLLGRQSGSS
jgi:flagellar protein FliO/FliZ